MSTIRPTPLERLRRARLLDHVAVSPETGPRPASAAETAIWLQAQIRPDSPAYHVAVALRADNPLDRDALAGAWRALHATVPGLHTSFHEKQGAVIARVDPDAESDPIRDLGQLAANPHNVLAAVAREPFDLTRAPLARLAIGRAADGGDVLLFVTHHIVADAHATNALLARLNAATRGADALDMTPAHPAATTDPSHLAWWVNQLGSSVPPGAIPRSVPTASNGTPPLPGTGRGGRIRVWGPGEGPSARRAADTTALEIAALRYAVAETFGERDVLVGLIASDRRADDLSFTNRTNILPLRHPLRPGPITRSTVEHEHQVVLDALQHRDAPFEVIRREVPAALAPIDVIYSRFETASTFPTGLEVFELDLGTAKFGMTLQSQSFEGRTVAYLEFGEEVFTPDEARVFADRLLAVTKELGRQREPGAALPAAPHPGSGVAANAPSPDRGLAGRFEQWAAAKPGAVAAATDEQNVTYGDLDARAERLAAMIEDRGESRAPVGVLLERGIDLVVAVVAMAKTGRAIMPFDTEHPSDRILQLAERAGVSLWITEPRHRQRVQHAGATIHVPGAGEAQRPGPDGTARRGTIHPGCPAYLIATSGSTGEPKIVQVSHANALGLLDGAGEHYTVGPGDSWSFAHSIAFDFSVWELWGALTTGGRIAVASRQEARDPSALVRFLHRHDVSVLSQTPSAFLALTAVLTTFDAPVPLSLRWVTLGGELCRAATFERWRDVPGGERVRVVNMYGITETTVHVTFRELDSDDLGRADSPIGHALPGMTATVLDSDFRPAAPEQTGELFVAGVGVADGYLGDPRRTALAYVPDPNGHGTRGYRTGDMAALRGGELIALGRADAQVKVRGHRIELGEVEAAILAHPSVQQVHVALRSNGSGLDAFVTLRGEGGDLHEWLASRLPGYMVPAVRVVEAIPRTTNGKVDAEALRQLARAGDPQRAAVEPKTEIEARICAIWGEVLEVEAVSPLDSFFGRGGDSLLAVSVASRMREAGIAAAVADIYEHQSVRGVIAAAVARPAPDGDALPRPDSRGSWPMTLLQQGMLFHQESGGDYVNLTSTLVGGRFDESLLGRAVALVFDRHEVLRTRFDLDAPTGPRQVVDLDCVATVTMLDWSDISRPAAEQRLRAWRVSERERGIDVAAAPLLRFTAHLLSDSEFWLSATECHALLDGWSFTSTIAEIVEVYADLLDGKDSQKPQPPAGRFAENAAAERLALADREMGARLSDLVESSVPLSLPRTGARTEHGVQDRMIELVPPGLLERLDEFVGTHGLPLKSALMAATSLAISRYSGQAQYLLGVVVNSRPETQAADDVRGMYLNTLPHAVDVRGRTTRLIDLVRASFEAEQELIRARAFPGVELVRRLGADAEPGALFNYTRFRALRRSRDRSAAILGTFEEDAPTSYPLYVSFDHSGDPTRPYLALLITAQPEYFTDEQVQLLLSLIIGVLEDLVDDPHRHVNSTAMGQTPRSSVATRQRASATPLAHLVERTVAHARAFPAEPAVVEDDAVVTRRELDTRRRNIAAGLSNRGIEAGDRVGVHLPRGIDHLTDTLAIWSIGAVYVPIDPDTPPGRRDLMVQASRLSLSVVTSASGWRGGVSLDELASVDADLSATDSIRALRSVDPAYVMFTSGSTGRPKGVVVTHGNLAAAADSIGSRLSSEDRVLWSTTPSFDISLVESVLALAAGACVHVAPNGTFDPDAIATLMESGDITVAQGTPTWWEEIASTGARLTAVEAWVGGEALSGRLVQMLAETRALLNWYGPTECTIWSSVRDASGDTLRDPAPIGDALPGEQLLLLSSGDPSPDGCAGELFISGDGVADGYLDDPRLTARAFVPNPWGPPGSRSYRTGDRGRLGTDGSIEFLGRMSGDRQVKYRGNRIDLREVEAAATSCPGISSAIAHIVSGRLVTFCVTRPGSVVTPSDVQRHAAQLLSRSVVPRFILIERLPRLPNGKVDVIGLRALSDEPIPEKGSGPSSDDGSVIGDVASIWASVLGLPAVDTATSFLDLGGDSISALRVSARFRARGWNVPPGAVLTSASAADLAPTLLNHYDDGAR